jgi:putative flavoprotein involved in K+ transport
MTRHTAPLSPTAHAAAWLDQFATALAAGDPGGATLLFQTDCYWRDFLAFTWNLSTQQGQPAIRAMLQATLSHTRPAAWRLTEDATQAADGTIEAWLAFETALGRGTGQLRLQGDKAFTLLTTLSELKGFEEARGPTRPRGVQHGVHQGRTTWLEQRQHEAATLGVSEQPYVVIVGGGQGGIALGARLRRLNVPALVLERLPRAGDSWRRRYKSLCLHDPVWFDHMPYLPFPDHWPVFSPKDKIADWLEAYVTLMEIPYWGGTEVLRAGFDDATRSWTVEATRDGQAITLRPKHLVLATGMSGMPNMPRFPGQGTFRGVQVHSSQHQSGETYAGKRAVIIGANNSAHDIAADLWEHGAAEVTMVQRSPTTVMRSETLMELSSGRLYSEAALAKGITTERADMIGASVPHALAPSLARPITQAIAAHDAALYERLRAVGFMLDFGEDGSGLSVKYQRRGSGYYIDVGASELVASGAIRLKSRVGVDHLTEDSVVLTDGTALPADLVVYATGYGSMNSWAAKLISQDVADRVGKCWGLGSGTTNDPGPWEGEQRNMWKPTQQDGLWFMGGNLHQARFYSLFLALQLKARQEGLPVPVHGLPKVHHLA